jgi:hypothetical protein
LTARGRLGFHTANFLVSFFGIAMFNAMLADPTAKRDLLNSAPRYFPVHLLTSVS